MKSSERNELLTRFTSGDIQVLCACDLLNEGWDGPQTEVLYTQQLGHRVTVNVETFCGECFFCRNGWVNNCIDPTGGWALGCRIDGGLAEYVRVPLANQGLSHIPDGVTDRQALFVGDVLVPRPLSPWWPYTTKHRCFLYRRCTVRT